MSRWYRRVLHEPKNPDIRELADRLKATPGFMDRLLTDNDNADKLEDRHPFNTFVELLLGIIAVATSATMVVTVISEIIQGIAALKDLGWVR